EHGGGELVGEELGEQADHAGLGGGEGAGSGVGGVAEFARGPLDPGAHLVGDGAFAAEGVGRGRAGHARGAGDVADGGHGSSAESRTVEPVHTVTYGLENHNTHPVAFTCG